MITLLYSGYYDMDNSKNIFEVDPNFFYLTSCDLPNILVLKKHTKHYIYVEIPSIKWYDNESFLEILNYCFNGELIGIDKLMNLIKSTKVQTLPNIKTHPQWSKLKKLNLDTDTINQKLLKQRTIKHIDEIQSIEKACKYTSDAIKYILSESYPKMSQIELIGLFKHSLSKKGIQELSFNPITSHGKYNQYLHYIAKDRPIVKGSMVLLDLGCKYRNYCSDISRCFPISGKFTVKQKEIYTVVLNSLKYALRQIKPNSFWNDITRNVKLKLYDECCKIRLVNQTKSEDDKLNLMRLLMPHDLGHHVGLDNHDCGPIETIKENMVIAVEPGIYFQNNVTSPLINMKSWNQYKSIGGIRLEDTIVITKTGYKNLSKVSKEISSIEKLMK